MDLIFLNQEDTRSLYTIYPSKIVIFIPLLTQGYIKKRVMLSLFLFRLQGLAIQRISAHPKSQP